MSLADLSTMHGEVLLLRHVMKLMALDLQLRVKVFYLRDRQCEKLIYNSILWHLYAVQRLFKPSKAPKLRKCPLMRTMADILQYCHLVYLKMSHELLLVRHIVRTESSTSC